MLRSFEPGRSTVFRFVARVDGQFIAQSDCVASCFLTKPKRLGILLLVNRNKISKIAAMLGKLGGSVKSKAKAAAARKNGKLGGRPRKAKP